MSKVQKLRGVGAIEGGNREGGGEGRGGGGKEQVVDIRKPMRKQVPSIRYQIHILEEHWEVTCGNRGEQPHHPHPRPHLCLISSASRVFTLRPSLGGESRASVRNLALNPLDAELLETPVLKGESLASLMSCLKCQQP